jgi:hypothetical protein
MRNKPVVGRCTGVAVLAACLTLAACDDSTGPQDEELGAASAEDLATFVVGLDASGGAEYGMTSDPRRTGTHTFTRSGPCPAGGTHTMSGSSTSTFDAATRVLSTTWSHTQTHDDCAVTHKRGDQEITAVIDGSVTVDGSASYEIPETRGAHRKILSYTSRRTGSTTTTIGDRTRTCAIDLTQTYDPATGQFTVKGTMCGREVNVTYTPGQRDKR